MFSLYLNYDFTSFCDIQLLIKSHKPLKGGWRKNIVISTICFWTELANDVHALFQILNSGVIRKIIPSQPLRAKEVGVFFFSKKIKTLNYNLGQGSSLSWSRCTVNGITQLIQVHKMAPKKSLQNKRRWWFRIIIKTGSHYPSK